MLPEAVADYGVHYGGYCKLWGLRVADLVYWAQDKLLFCRELQLQPMAMPTNAPVNRGVLLWECNFRPKPRFQFWPFFPVDRSFRCGPAQDSGLGLIEPEQ